MAWDLERPTRPGADHIHTYDEVVSLRDVGGIQRATVQGERARNTLLGFFGFSLAVPVPVSPVHSSISAPLVPVKLTPTAPILVAPTPASTPPSQEPAPTPPTVADVLSTIFADHGEVKEPETDDWRQMTAWAASNYGEVAQADPGAMADWVRWQGSEYPTPERRPVSRPEWSLPKELPDGKPVRNFALILCVHGWGETEERAAVRCGRLVAKLGKSSCLHVVQNREEDWARTCGSVSALVPAGRYMVTMTPNTGFAAACNAGMREAEADGARWILFTQADCSFSLLAIKRAVGLAQSTGCVVGPSGGHLVPGPSVREYGRNIGQLGGPEQVGFVAGYWLLCRVSDLRKAGGWDDGLFLYWEDVDVCQRLAALGLPSVVWPDLEVDHARGQTIRRKLFPSRVVERIRAQSQDRFSSSWSV